MPPTTVVVVIVDYNIVLHPYQTKVWPNTGSLAAVRSECFVPSFVVFREARCVEKQVVSSIDLAVVEAKLQERMF